MAYSWIEITPATGAVAIYELKELLVAQGWAVLSSGDGLGAFGASSDVITSGTAGANGLGNTNAWFNVEHPDGSRQFTFQRSTTSLVWRCKFSVAAGFTGGAAATAQTPSATDEIITRGGGTDAAPSYSSIFSGADGSYRWKAGADNASPYNMWAYAFPTGGGGANACVHIESIGQLSSTDADGTWLRIVNGAPDSTVLNDDTGVQTGWSFQASASPTPSLWAKMTVYWMYTDSTKTIPLGQGVNPITGDDQLFPLTFGRRKDVSNSGFKGVSNQTCWNSVARADGDTLSTSVLRDRIVFGDINVPWNGSVPTV